MKLFDSYIKATLELTYNCNYNCVHCYNKYKSDDRTNRFLSFEDVKIISDKLDNLDMIRVNLFGGEPLLHPQFPEIYQFLYKKGFQISLITNGSLINQNIIDLFKKFPPFLFQISLYGYDEQSYLATTGTRCFNAVFSNLKALTNNNISFFVKYVLLTTNNNIDNARQLMDEYSFNYTIYPYLLPNLDRDCDNLKFQVSYEQISEVMHKESLNRNMYKAESLNHTAGGFGSTGRCNVWRQDLIISPFGAVRPCVPFSLDTKINILDTDEKSMIELLGKSFEELNSYPATCNNCDDKKYCSCPVILNLYKDPKAVCPQAKIRKGIYEKAQFKK